MLYSRWSDLETIQKKRRTPWARSIIAANMRGSFTVREKERASDWETCASAELVRKFRASRLWERKTYVPLDGHLYSLGQLFTRFVVNDQIEQAGSTYIKILERVQELK